MSLRNNMPRAEISLFEWKRQGDEILFYVKYPDKKTLLMLPSYVYKALEEVIDSLSKYNQNSMVQLSAKATIWSAVISKNFQAVNDIRPKSKDNLFNVATLPSPLSDNRGFDFLGPDIDTGFRIADYAVSGKLVIDAYLAWYIMHSVKTEPIDTEIEGTVQNTIKNMRIVSLENLKGIWYGRRYPIIWYLKKWEDSYDDMFLYDEEYTSEVVRHIKEKNKPPKEIEVYLEKILEQVNLLDRAHIFAKSIEDYENKPVKLEKRFSAKMVTLRLVAICKNQNNKILIFKRGSKKRHFSNLWEFGCTYLKPEQTILDAIKKGYKRKYNVIISIDEEAMPVDYGERPRGDSSVVISELIYHVHTASNTEPSYDLEDYSECKWIDLDDAKKINENEAVPGFHRRIENYLMQ